MKEFDLSRAKTDEQRYEEYKEARSELKNQIIRRLPCTRYLDKARNGGYICIYCGSGSGPHGTGAVKYYSETNTCACHACPPDGQRARKFDVIDCIMHKYACDYNGALQIGADDLGLEMPVYDKRIDEGWKQHKEGRQDYDINNLVLDDKQELYRQSAEEKEAERKAAEKEKSDARLEQYLQEYRKNVQEPAQGDLMDAGEETTAAAAKAARIDAQEPTGANTADYTEYYKQCRQRLSDPAAISYLQARGISPETAAAYNLGYDPAADPARSNHPCPRLIIPTSRAHYVGRRIDGIKEFAKMNPKGSKPAIFNLRAVYENNEAVFVTEGIFDALSIIEAGAAAVALNSTSNADILIEQLEKDATRATLVLCLDNDKAGKEATDRLRKGLTRLNVSYITADICGSYGDPNEALTADREAFIAAIRDAQAQTAARPDNINAYIDTLMLPEIERLRAAADRKTGFATLDQKSGGLYPGLYVIAATSSLGKTTFSLQAADNLAAAGHDVLFFSMEQSRLELVSKSFSRILTQEKDEQISSLSLRKGYQREKLQEAAAIYKATIGEHMSIIEGNFNCNITFIGDYIRRYIRRNGGSPIVFIDYLQILQPAETTRPTSVRETVDNTVTELKRISREHDLTVFVISSVNRANYMTPIDFESLKESGGIEYTADVIWGLQLQCLNEPVFEQANKIKEKRQRIRQAKAEDPRKIELLCLKNRYGVANFSCNFDYYPSRDLFVNVIDDFHLHEYYGENPLNEKDNGQEKIKRL